MSALRADELHIQMFFIDETSNDLTIWKIWHIEYLGSVVLVAAFDENRNEKEWKFWNNDKVYGSHSLNVIEGYLLIKLKKKISRTRVNSAGSRTAIARKRRTEYRYKKSLDDGDSGKGNHQNDMDEFNYRDHL